jgi:DNA-directed RNA polymerase specialized sigma24 family protein
MPSSALERHVTEKSAAVYTATAAPHSSHLHELIAGIAAGNMSAFRGLYAVLAVRVWRDASRLMPHPGDAWAVTRATFVEVWHLARFHVDAGGLDPDAWIAAITAHQLEERLRSNGRRSLVRHEYDRHTYREFAAIIGAGKATPSASTNKPSKPPIAAPEESEHG